MKTAPRPAGCRPGEERHWAAPPPGRPWSAALTEDVVHAAGFPFAVSHTHPDASSLLHGIQHYEIRGAGRRPVLISSPNLHTSSPNSSFLSASIWTCLFSSICDSELCHGTICIGIHPLKP